jgi:gluconate 2-dehydrogenase gamma chain
MAGQSIERREMMRILALASVASTFPGFRKWTFACEHAMPDKSGTTSASDTYQPQFCSPEEYVLVERLTELIIPTDDKPGAREAGVSEFIDFRVWTDSKVQQHFRYGLGWISAHGIRLHGKPFLQLSADQQNEMLRHLAYKAEFRRGEEDGQQFFKLIRRLTVMGFYTSRIGLEQLDYPGLQTMWSEMPGCPHKDDPEHAHLTAPRA